MQSFFTLCFMFILCTTMVQTATDTDVRNLLTQLLNSSSYDKRVKPKINQSETVVAYVRYVLFSLSDLNEVEEKLTTTGYLDIYWKDEFLTWNQTLFGNLEYVYIPQDSVWKPDIALQNGFKNLQELGSKFIQVYVQFDGRIEWSPFQIFESKCNLDLTYFPFDQQTCNLDFTAWSFDMQSVVMYAENDWINVDAAIDSNSQWDLIAWSSKNISELNESKISFSITVERKPLFAMMNIFFPIALLSILNLFTFQIPADTGERMGYTITVWLAFAVFLTIVSNSLPKSSDTIPVVSIYIMIQLCVGTVTVVISAIESRMVCRSNDKKVPAFISKISLICRRPRVAPSEEKNNINIAWKNGMAAIDSLLFWILIVILVLVTFMIMMIVTLSR